MSTGRPTSLPGQGFGGNRHRTSTETAHPCHSDIFAAQEACQDGTVLAPADGDPAEVKEAMA